MPELRHARPGGDAPHGRARGRGGADARDEVALKVLLLGIGNPGRRDDGLGPRIAEALEGDGRVHAEFRYQLGIEDAFAARDRDVVIFADAAKEGDEPATLVPVEPGAGFSFTTHALEPAAVLALCRELYSRVPKAYILAVRGYDWDVGEGLSEGAERNLSAALALVEEFLNSN